MYVNLDGNAQCDRILIIEWSMSQISSTQPCATNYVQVYFRDISELHLLP